ncbi:DUF1298 domain-containing protein [Streptomyces sp. ISL-36]|uniref:wax ester/triacylglycerol synthase domain-containing protein n=1 Tax=Streptomyces sp. ISL-36 TaxID=2819182 RepID=UPI001BEAAD8E|nr:wax ester/triacylglycerol synthase domain-containing protein [Streptomyces sp. ISL-36]MBT2443091.1 DUF1298 domain-containing protein [Streptomyces sp. ISL-36]
MDAVLALQQENSGFPATIGLVAVFPGPAPTPEQLNDRVRQRLGPVTRLRLRMETDARGRLRRPYVWRLADELDVACHVAHDRLRSGQCLEDLAADLIGRSMPRVAGGPLWDLRVVHDAAPGHFALVLRAHHALLDGASMLTVMRLLGDDKAGSVSPVPRELEAVPAATGGVREMAQALRGLGRRPGRYQCSESVAVSGRTVAWSSFPADVMDAARKALPEGRTSPNNVFLAAFTSAVHACPGLLGRGPRLDRVCAAVPVDLRGPEFRHALGNFLSGVRVRLPLEMADPMMRLREVGRQMDDNKRLRSAHGLARFVDYLAGLGGVGVRFVARQMGIGSLATFSCSFPGTAKAPRI